jgi:hypothetical protein
MLRKRVAIAGITLFLLGIGLALWLWRGRVRANELDQGQGRVVVTDCQIASTITLPRRVMTENESQMLTVTLVNESVVACEVPVLLNAPNFDVAGELASRSVNVEPQSETAVVWILSPEKAGTFQIAVNVAGELAILGITVTDVLGLTALQARLLSIIGSVLGPILTVPWWIERWQERQGKE